MSLQHQTTDNYKEFGQDHVFKALVVEEKDKDKE